MFITNHDYTALIKDEIKNLLQEGYTGAKFQQAEQMAISQVKNYLAGRYDVNEIFDQTGNDRNHHIVMITIDCTLYHLYTSTVPDKMPSIRSERYQDAIDWLKLIANGKAHADLPKIKDDAGKAINNLKVSSKYEKQNHKW